MVLPDGYTTWKSFAESNYQEINISVEVPPHVLRISFLFPHEQTR
jgi:hypothetical protein